MPPRPWRRPCQAARALGGLQALRDHHSSTPTHHSTHHHQLLPVKKVEGLCQDFAREPWQDPQQGNGAPGEDVPGAILGWLGRRWEPDRCSCRKRLGKGGSGPRADKDVFSSLKFDFHDLFAAGYRSPGATPSTDWGRLCFPC